MPKIDILDINIKELKPVNIAKIKESGKVTINSDYLDAKKYDIFIVVCEKNDPS